MENTWDTRVEQPVGTGESENEVIDHLYRLPFPQQLEALRALAPRILGRLLEPQRERFIANLRRAPVAEKKISRTSAGHPVQPIEKVIGDVLRQSLAEQLDILNRAAPRIVADLEGHERTVFLDDLDLEIQKAEAGEPTLEEHPIA